MIIREHMRINMITQQELKKEIIYYPLTGNFNKKTGKQERLGTFRHLVIKSKRYKKRQLAWLYMTGVCPDVDMVFLDGDDRNFKFNNLSTQKQTNINIVNVDDKLEISIDGNNLGVYNDLDTAFDIIKMCLRSMIL